MSNKFLTSYIRASNDKAQEQRKEFYLLESINLYIKDPLTRDVDVRNVMEKIKATVPSHLMSEIDSIFVGIFDEFEEMETNAMYRDGAIYLTNDQDNEDDMIDDIIHEIAHSLEAAHGHLIYGDGELQDEFMSKRIRLYDVLKSENLKPKKKLFLNPDYTREMDLYLYEKVGYDRLNFIVSSYSLFTSAYSATSLREYYANGFEYYFLDDRKYLYEICPVLYKKIEELYENE